MMELCPRGQQIAHPTGLQDGAECRERRGLIVNLKPSGVLHQNREMIRSVALKHHTRNPRVFGSVLSGEDEGSSDLDLLVEPLPGTTLLFHF